MLRTMLNALAVAACLSFAGGAQAATVYKTILAGTNENPPNASAGIGAATLTIDGVMMTLEVDFSGLTGTTTASHIHCCTTPDLNAGVATQTPTFLGFPLGVTSGSYSNSFDMSLSSSWNASYVTANGGTTASALEAFIAGLDAGKAYLNIHTTFAPGGEIRGQWAAAAAVPEPAAWAMLITGFGLAGTALRRRRVSPLEA